jgi:hypothetical protein
MVAPRNDAGASHTTNLTVLGRCSQNLTSGDSATRGFDVADFLNSACPQTDNFELLALRFQKSWLRTTPQVIGSWCVPIVLLRFQESRQFSEGSARQRGDNDVH